MNEIPGKLIFSIAFLKYLQNTGVIYYLNISWSSLAIRNADVLLNACKDTGLAVIIGKTKYMEIGRHRGMIANTGSTASVNKLMNSKVIVINYYTIRKFGGAIRHKFLCIILHKWEKENAKDRDYNCHANMLEISISEN